MFVVLILDEPGLPKSTARSVLPRSSPATARSPRLEIRRARRRNLLPAEAVRDALPVYSSFDAFRFRPWLDYGQLYSA